jgi:uncharacterized membrane protein
MKRRDWMVPTALIALAAFPMLAGAARLIGMSAGKELVSGQARFMANPGPIVLHIVGAIVFSLAGAFQFSRQNTRWHRRAGWLVAPAGLVTALAGVWMTLVYPLDEYDGPLLRGVRLIAGLGMAATIVTGVRALLRGDFHAHGRWMTRAYALGIAAGTQSILVVPQVMAGHVMGGRGYALTMAAGWIINLAVAEWRIRTRHSAGTSKGYGVNERARAQRAR